MAGIFRSVKPRSLNLEEMLINDSDVDDVEKANEPFEEDDSTKTASIAG